MIEIARLTGVTAINPGFAPYKDWFEAPSQQSTALWPVAASVGRRTKLLLLLLNPRTPRLYHHVRITRQWRLDGAKFYPERVPGLARYFRFIAFDRPVAGRHAGDKLGPTFMLPDGRPDYFS